MDNIGLDNIIKMYDHSTYFDTYGGSVLLFIVITFFYLLLCRIVLQK